MPEVLKEWPVKRIAPDRFDVLFDEKIYRVNPAEFECDTAEELEAKIRYAAALKRPRIYIRVFVTLDAHVIVSKRPSSYVPRTIGGRPKTKKETPS